MNLSDSSWSTPRPGAVEGLGIVHQRVLRWFWHVERIDEYRMARRVLMANVNGGQGAR